MEKAAEYNSLCIDLKSFYASVECVERGLDPMTTDLVVADPERSRGTICLAVSPSLRAKGVRNRCRVYEIPQGLSYIMAPPRMQKYIDYAAEIYGVYLRYLSPEDIHVYSIDEAFLNVGPYLHTYGMTAEEMAVMLMERIRDEIGVRAAAGVGTNLYLAKIALDILAKHAENYVAVLNENTYRERLWDHRPLTDFWQIGSGTAGRLARMGIFTMRQTALTKEEILYHAFGINAELLIDHAWGRETTTIRDIKAYKPKSTSLSSGQVLMRDYTFAEGRVILQEMTDQLCMDMLERKMATSSVTFLVGFTHAAGRRPLRRTVDIPTASNAAAVILPEVLSAYDGLREEFFDAFGEDGAMIRRFSVSCNALVPESRPEQIALFFEEDRKREREKQLQKAVLHIKNRFGKNALLRGTDLTEAATIRER
ncbi:MAG: DNA repair protein, partial [Eubacterium sp.]|nr:DNA repair protein [Eubacterium sp.]